MQTFLITIISGLALAGLLLRLVYLRVRNDYSTRGEDEDTLKLIEQWRAGR